MKNTVEEKEMVVNAVIEEIQNDNPSNIQTGYDDDFSQAKTLVWKKDDKGYTPDIIAEFDDGKRNIYEIELNGDINTDKWKLFSAYARKYKGEFFIVLPEDNMEEVKEAIKSNQITNVHLYYFNGSA